MARALRRLAVRPEALVMGAAIAALFVVSVIPFSMLFVESLSADGRFSLSTFARVLGGRRNITALGNTVKLGLATALFTVVVGAPLAWLVSRTNLPGARLFRTLFTIPYMVPPFIGAVGWSALLNRRNGMLNVLFGRLSGTGGYLVDVNTLGGLVWVMTLYLYPFVFITAVGALERMDPSLEEAARCSGARTFRIMADITLPLVAPSIASGALLAFSAAIANFGIPALVGMQGRVYVMTTMIYSLLRTGGFKGIAMGAALSIVLLGLSVVALVASNLALSRRQYTLIAGKSLKPQIADLRGWKIPAVILACLVVAVTVVLPLGTIVVSSFFKAWGADLSWENLTLKNYRYILFEYDLTRTALRNSLLLGAASATVAMVLGSLVAYISLRTRLPGRKVVETVAVLPYTVPGTVVAIAMILAWSGRFGVNLYNTFWILLVAYVSHYLAYAVRTASASLQQVHVSLEEAARACGANWLRSFRDVVVPLIRPGLIAGWFLIFMPTLRELTISILLWGPRTATMGVAIFEMQDAGYFQISAAFSTMLLVIVLAGNGLLKAATRGKVGI